jgi:CheY-like chemotaxis protein
MPAAAEGGNGNAVATGATGFYAMTPTPVAANGEATNKAKSFLLANTNGEKTNANTANGSGNGSTEQIEEKQALPGSTQALPLLEPKNLRILVVDSDNDSSNGTCNVLQDCGYQVVSVKTSKQAFEELDKVSAAAVEEEEGKAGGSNKSKSFDIILKEHEPPKSDACRMLKKVWNHKTYRNIPIVITSNSYESDTIQKCLQFGAADYMLKPLRPQEARTLWVRVWRRLVAMQFDPNQNNQNNNQQLASWHKQLQEGLLLRQNGLQNGDGPLALQNNLNLNLNGQNGPMNLNGGPVDQQSLSGMSTQSDADVDGDSHEGSNPNDQNERKQMNGDQDNNQDNSDEQPRTHDHIHGGTNDRVGPNTITLHLLHSKNMMNKMGQQNNGTNNGLGSKSVMTASAFQAFNSPWNRDQTTSKRKEMEGNGDSNGNGNGSNGKNAASNIIGPYINGNSNGNGSNGNGNGNHESNGASSRRIMPKVQQPREVGNNYSNKKIKLQQDHNGHHSAHPFSMNNNNNNMTITPFGPMPSHLAQSVFWGMAAQQEMNYLTAMQWNGVNPGAQAALAAAAANAAANNVVHPTANGVGVQQQQQQQEKNNTIFNHGKDSKGKCLQKDSGDDVSGKTTSTQTAADSIVKESTSAERRAAALDKFRQKKKTLCFSKKIRYASRKQLAEARPRIKGQFVKTDSGSKDSGSGRASKETSPTIATEEAKT